MKIPVYPDAIAMSSRKNGYEVSDDTINSWIRDGIGKLQGLEDSQQTMTSAGDTMVIVQKYVEDETFYQVIVCKGYYQQYIYEYE